MFTRLSKTAAVLSGVTASLMITTSATAQNQPVVVRAEPQEGIRTELVSYADLDLTTAKGEKRLNYRVAGAVKRVCLFNDGRIGLQNNGYRTCADGALDSAQPQIANAVTRARELAMYGKSSIAATAITINIPAS